MPFRKEEAIYLGVWGDVPRNELKKNGSQSHIDTGHRGTAGCREASGLGHVKVYLE